MTTTIDDLSVTLHDRLEAVETRKTPPIKIWAFFGVLSLGCFVFLWTSWIASGKAKTVHVGATPLPHWMHVEFVSWEIAGLFAFAATVWYFLVRPWRREGRITLDGLMVVAFLTLYWQDPLGDASGAWFTYNAGLINFGSWLGNVPGHLLPHANQMPEPLVWVWPVYVYCCFLMVVIGTRFMQWVKARWPRTGNLGLVITILVAFWVFDALLEIGFNWLGIYSYTGALKGASVFSGHYFRFPFYEALMFGTTWAGWTCVRFFKNDKGQTLAERGLDDVRSSGWKRTGLRLLALIGIFNVVFLLTYNVPAQFFGLHQGAWPKDVTSRSYLTDGLCGQGTGYACPGPLVPIPTPSSAHVGPNGQLIVPPGQTIPTNP